MNGIYESNIARDGLDYFTGTASFAGPKEIVTSEGVSLTADHILIASGSTPAKPTMKGAELCITSDEIFSLEELPKSMISLGGGYIGTEMAQIMQGLGVKTTVLARGDMLRMVDQDIIPLLLENMEKLGLDCRLNTPFTGVERAENGMLRVNLADGGYVEAEVVLNAMGRPPNLEGLNLENAGVEVVKGAVKVDEYQNTNIPGIYAIGDATNQVNLTPVAIRQGRIVSERVFNGRTDLKMCYDNIATAIFTHPPIAVVGLSETAANKKFGEGNVKVYRSTFINMYYSPAKSDDKKLKSMFKLVCHVEADGTERVVGCHTMGKSVDEMMQGISIAITMGATKQDFDNSVAIHPTASEEFVLMDAKII